MTYHLHQVPGRLRFTDARWERDTEGLALAVAALRQVAGVTDVTANPATGSVTVTYEPKRVGAARVIDVLTDHTEAGGRLVARPGLYAMPRRVSPIPLRAGLSASAARVLRVSAKIVDETCS